MPLQLDGIDPRLRGDDTQAMHPEFINQAIVTSARSWIGTRFQHQGRLKKTVSHHGGVDCLGLLIGVAKELNLQSATGKPLWQLDETHYSRTPDHQKLFNTLDTHLFHKPIHQARAGDIGLFNIQQSPQHLAIFSDYPPSLGLIHAYAQARKVVEHHFDGFWQGQLIAVFSVSAIDEPIETP